MHMYCTGIARRRSYVHARVALQACFESRLFMNPSVLAAAAVPGVRRVQSGVFTRSFPSRRAPLRVPNGESKGEFLLFSLQILLL